MLYVLKDFFHKVPTLRIKRFINKIISRDLQAAFSEMVF